MSHEPYFKVLGPWEIGTNRGPVTIPPGQLRTLLASLLMSANQPVSVSTLADQLWPEGQPSRVRGSLYTYVGRLRKLLGADLIRTSPGSYQLSTLRQQIDLHQFRDLLARSRETTAVGDELTLLRAALALWRGRPFTDVPSSWLDRDVVPRLTEEWFEATERKIDIELVAGKPGKLIADLWELTDRYPTRESLWVRLISALHVTGRRAEALDAYRRVRTVLRDQLGIDPGEQLTRLQQEILRGGEPARQQPPAPQAEPTPRQLPHDIANFAGRYDELATLDALLAQSGSAAPGQAPTIISIDGAPGIGKTALAVHWAHRIAHHYPEVQLYLNLRGYGPGEPVSPDAAVESLLRGLGVDSGLIPSDVDERSALLRSTLSGRQALIMLDNARDADQVRPLLPGADGLVIVTSRNQLRGLSIRDGAHRVTLNPLPPPQSIELLAAAIGPERVAGEPEAAATLVELCDYLPLALSIVAERALRSGLLADVVRALEDEKARLDNLGTGEDDPHTDLRAALSWSYQALSAEAARMFRALGLHPASDIGLDAAAALVNVPPARAKEALDRLVAAHLVEQRRPYRYELHDLIRLYATDLATAHEPGSERDAMVGRVLDWYLHAAASADLRMMPSRRHDFLEPYEPRALPPRFADSRQATRWFEREFDCLRSVVCWAAANGWAGHSWRTAMAMTTFFDSAIPWREGLEFYRSALRAAESTGDCAGEAYVLNSLGCIHLDKGDRLAALPYFERSLSLFQMLPGAGNRAMVLGNLALTYGEMGLADAAREHATQALELFKGLNFPRGIAQNLDNLGVALSAAGEYQRAIECHHQSDAIFAELGDDATSAWNQHNLARAYAGHGATAQAVKAFRRAIMLHRAAANRRWETIALADLGALLNDNGHPGIARRIWRTVLATIGDFDDTRAKEIQNALATTVTTG